MLSLRTAASTKSIVACYATFPVFGAAYQNFPALSFVCECFLLASSSDWLIALFSFAVIGQVCAFVMGKPFCKPAFIIWIKFQTIILRVNLMDRLNRGKLKNSFSNTFIPFLIT